MYPSNFYSFSSPISHLSQHLHFIYFFLLLFLSLSFFPLSSSVSLCNFFLFSLFSLFFLFFFSIALSSLPSSPSSRSPSKTSCCLALSFLWAEKKKRCVC
ncbi:unnamed protein product [Prunus armeniaca]